MSDIHGCLAEFDAALALVLDHLEEKDTQLILLGDYVHGGPDGKGVLDRSREIREEAAEIKNAVSGEIEKQIENNKKEDEEVNQMKETVLEIIDEAEKETSKNRRN